MALEINRDRRNFLFQASAGALSLATTNGRTLMAGDSEDATSWGAPAPGWLRDADMYNGQYFSWTDAQFDRSKGFPVIVSPDHTKSTMERLKSYGVRTVCYIQECTIPSLKRRAEIIENEPPHEDNEAYGFVHNSPFYRFVDVDEHPQFVWVDEKNQGKERRRAFEGDYGGNWDGWRQCCPNSEGFRDAYIAGVKAVMELGVDGLFLDSFGTNAGNKCHGPELGVHRHENPKKTTYEADLWLLQGVYEAVKSYGSDKVVWLNGGRPNAATFRYADAQMMESIICTHVSKRRWHTFEEVRKMADKRKHALAAGKVITPLSYVGYTNHEPVEDTFYCYAVARVLGLLWADWFTSGNSQGTILYKTRLGGSRSEMLDYNGMYYRLFNNGVVVVNPTGEPRKLKVKTGFTFLRDVLTNRRYSPHDESKGATLPTEILEVVIPAQAGRVFVQGFSS